MPGAVGEEKIMFCLEKKWEKFEFQIIYVFKNVAQLRENLNRKE